VRELPWVPVAVPVDFGEDSVERGRGGVCGRDVFAVVFFGHE
jgi:hypothetical protein